jgi:hypothetical protein
MTHFSSREFVEALDDTLAAARHEHLRTCATCERRLAELRGVMGVVTNTDAARVPEPSPLFWEHFNRRVREATDPQAIPTSPKWWEGVWRPVVALGALAAAVVLGFSLRVKDPATIANPNTEAVAAELLTDASAAERDDVAVEVMTAVTGELSWDEAHAVNLAPAQSLVHMAVSRLSAAQQKELIRLLQTDISGLE